MSITWEKAYWKYLIQGFLLISFFFVELVVGILIQSLSLQADAVHMLADILSLIVAFHALRLSLKKSAAQATFGWVRAEIVGALINGVFLISSCFFITIESIDRFREWEEIGEEIEQNVDLLLIVGGIGLFINIVGIVIFSHSIHGHSHSHSGSSLNIRALILHFIGDLLGSIAVMINGTLIKVLDTRFKFLADPLVSLIIVGIILFNAIPLVRKCYDILVHKVPKEIDMTELRENVSKIDGILGIHHFHVWQLNDTKNIASMHVILDEDSDYTAIFPMLQQLLHEQGIHATTIQPEHGTETCHNMVCSNSDCQEKMCCDDKNITALQSE